MLGPRLQQGMNVADALCLHRLWEGLPAPRAIITSPPYLDMQDYGSASNIGYGGQSVQEYSERMTELFKDCHAVAADDATFWLVAGSVRRDGRLIALPERLAACAEQAGWVLREAVTWDKQKALPWTHHGELRDITEQVLLFSKGDCYRFEPHQLRSPIPNSIWWRRYPERYSPDGSMPTNLWSIPIPTQGSWAGVRTHLCPFPEELTYRMLSLTTVPGDVVLDPLAGVGSVPAMAEAMGRIGYGLELTRAYAQAYKRTAEAAEKFLTGLENDGRRREPFRRTILELRLLKFAKLVGKRLTELGLPVAWVRVKKSRRRPLGAYKVISGDFEVVVDEEPRGEGVVTLAKSIASRPPLSKFGIDPVFVSGWVQDAAVGGHWYRSGQFWNPPEGTRPDEGNPHVVAAFKPDPDGIDDTPYA